MNKFTPDEAQMMLNLIGTVSIPANIPDRMETMTRVDTCIRKLEAMIPQPEEELVLDLPTA